MNTTNTITNQKERKEAIAARLQFVLESSHSSSPKNTYTLTSTGKKIDFSKQKNLWKTSRLVWRIGELRITECRTNLLEIKSFLQSEIELYSLVWTLGRIGITEDVAIIKAVLNANLESDTLVAVCFQSLLLLNADTDIKTALERDIPEKVINCIENNLFGDFKNILEANLSTDKCNNWLYWLYLLHWESPKVQEGLLSLLQEIPLQGNYFRPFRKILKAAEQFDDMETLALLYWKIQASDAHCNVFVRGDWEQKEDGSWYQKNSQKFVHTPTVYSIPLKEALKAEGSDFGFTLKSKKYFKTKFLRLLLRSGDAASPSFTTLATAYLLQVDDAQAQAAYSEPRYTYSHNEETGRWESQVKHLHYPMHHDKVPMYRLLYTHSEQYVISAQTNRVQVLEDKTNTRTRSELFPALWDASAAAIIRLLAKSKAALVHDFAAAVFTDNPSFATMVRPDAAAEMLARPYLQTQQLAVTLIQENYKRFEDSKTVFLALLNCKIPEGQQLALSWLATKRKSLLQDIEFLINLIVHPKENVNKWVVEAIQSPDFSLLQKTNLLQALFVFLQADPAAEHIQKVLVFIDKELRAQAKTVSEQVLRQLIEHPSTTLHLFAAKLMRQHERGVAKLPYELLLQLMESEQEEVRAAGIELFGLLPEADLYRQQLIVSNGCVSSVVAVRDAMQPVALKLSQAYPDFGMDLTETLSDFLLLRGKANPVHDAIAILLTNPKMEAFIKQLPTSKMWRLLRSKKYPAQQLGFAMLQGTVDAKTLDMVDLIALGKHELKAVRIWVHRAIQARPTRAVYEAKESLRLLETDWADSRAFMMNFARNEFKARDWTPDLLVSLCDSNRDEVQAFGLQQIQTYFKEENALQFLEQLSQHPSARVQLLAATWLEKHASGNIKQLEKLSPFFLTLLSQINKGRSAKKQVYTFLEKEALTSPEQATIIIPMLERLVLTIAINDRANCILLLNKIRRKYPHLIMQLRTNRREITGCDP